MQSKLFANPLDFPPEFRTWLEGFIETALPTSASFRALAAQYAWPVGYFRIIPEDLSAQTGVYVWTDPDTGLQGLYCNGAAASQTTYADLYAAWGASKYAADSGGNFTLPDTRGRPIWFTGTNTAADLGDSDGVAEASRTPVQSDSDVISITISGTTGNASAAAIAGAAGASATSNNHTHDFSGSDTDTANITITVPHFFIGSLVVRI